MTKIFTRARLIGLGLVLGFVGVLYAQEPQIFQRGITIIRGNLVMGGGTGNQPQFEGATANDYETYLAFSDVTADRTWTYPDNTGTIGKTLLGSLTWTRTAVADANYSVVAADVMVTYTSLGATSVRTVVLPSATDNQGRIVVVQDATGLSAGNATILTSGTINLTIGTSNTWAISTPFGSMRFVAGAATPNGTTQYSWFANAW